MRIKDLENHLERSDARMMRQTKIDAIRERNRLIKLVIKVNIAIISILCAVYAVYIQF